MAIHIICMEYPNGACPGTVSVEDRNMNKTIFEVGKTYLTRDGHKVLIKPYAGTMIIGTIHQKDGTEWNPMWYDSGNYMWYPAGNYFFSGQYPMDLMPTDDKSEPIIEEPSLTVTDITQHPSYGWDGWIAPQQKIRKELFRTIYEACNRDLSDVTSKQEKEIEEAVLKLGWNPPSDKDKADALREENATLFKANLDLLAEVDALQKENGCLFVELQESRVIALGMVDMVKRGAIHKIL